MLHATQLIGHAARLLYSGEVENVCMILRSKFYRNHSSVTKDITKAFGLFFRKQRTLMGVNCSAVRAIGAKTAKNEINYSNRIEGCCLLLTVVGRHSQTYSQLRKLSTKLNTQQQ